MITKKLYELKKSGKEKLAQEIVDYLNAQHKLVEESSDEIYRRERERVLEFKHKREGQYFIAIQPELAEIDELETYIKGIKQYITSLKDDHKRGISDIAGEVELVYTHEREKSIQEQRIMNKKFMDETTEVLKTRWGITKNGSKLTISQPYP